MTNSPAVSGLGGGWMLTERTWAPPGSRAPEHEGKKTLGPGGSVLERHGPAQRGPAVAPATSAAPAATQLRTERAAPRPK